MWASAPADRRDARVTLYISKPQVVEAVQWTGENATEVIEFGAGRIKPAPKDWSGPGMLAVLLYGSWTPIPLGHWIVHRVGLPGDLWHVDPIHFAATYAPTVEAATRGTGLEV